MAAEIDASSKTIFSTRDVDPQWQTQLYRIFSKNSMAGDRFMQIKNGKVTCTGTAKEDETCLKLYVDRRYNFDMLIECSVKNSDSMLCVADGQLTTKKKTHNYINFDDAEDDIIFSMVMPEDETSSKCQIKWKKEGKYIGFDVNGQPIPLGKVVSSQPEAFFSIVNVA